jgi:hypothetical protein
VIAFLSILLVLDVSIRDLDRHNRFQLYPSCICDDSLRLLMFLQLLYEFGMLDDIPKDQGAECKVVTFIKDFR